jgi:hypothetical protein
VQRFATILSSDPFDATSYFPIMTVPRGIQSSITLSLIKQPDTHNGLRQSSLINLGISGFWGDPHQVSKTKTD